jgi:hypothetical protein
VVGLMFHSNCGAETPSFGHGEEALLPFLYTFRFRLLGAEQGTITQVTASGTSNAGDSERQAPSFGWEPGV